MNPISLLWAHCKENKNARLSLICHLVSCCRKFMSWVEQLLKTIATQPNSDNMKYSFKIGIAFLYVTYTRFKVSNLASLIHPGDIPLRKIQLPSTILFQILPKVMARQTMHHGIPSKFPNTSPWIHRYILVTVSNKMSLFATWHTKTSPNRQQCNSSQWLISSIHTTASTLKRWPQQGNRKSHFDSSDYNSRHYWQLHNQWKNVLSDMWAIKCSISLQQMVASNTGLMLKCCKIGVLVTPYTDN